MAVVYLQIFRGIRRRLPDVVVVLILDRVVGSTYCLESHGL
jgi:hypothetical protein